MEDETNTDSNVKFITSICLEEEYVSQVSDNEYPKEIYAEMMINSSSLSFQVECGTSVNILPLKYVENCAIEPSKKSLHMWNGTNVTSVGSTRVTVHNPKNHKRYLRRASKRGQLSILSVYKKICMFCEKKDKYKGSKTRESLTQARQLRTDISGRTLAELKMDSRVLAHLTSELTAADAHYHRSCYQQYTNVSSTSAGISTQQNQNTMDDLYGNAEVAALIKSFNYIRNDIFVNKSIKELSKLNERLDAFMFYFIIGQCP